jgi:SAM-dependent methyltransferase
MSQPDKIQDLQDTWDRLGREDPMWAVASNRDRWSREEFFASGEAEIAEAMAYVESLGLELERRRALDFGCGLGRLTRALGDRYEETVGVDIAPSMTRAATELNADRRNVSFVVNDRPGLDALESGSFDLVFSNITLQHMAPELAARYIESFMRVVSDRGLVLFQLPSERRAEESGLGARLRRARRQGPRRTLRALTRRLSPQPTMEMHCIPREEVVRLVEDAGGTVRDVRANQNAGELYESFYYAATRA